MSCIWMRRLICVLGSCLSRLCANELDTPFGCSRSSRHQILDWFALASWLCIQPYRWFWDRATTQREALLCQLWPEYGSKAWKWDHHTCRDLWGILSRWERGVVLAQDLRWSNLASWWSSDQGWLWAIRGTWMFVPATSRWCWRQGHGR